MRFFILSLFLILQLYYTDFFCQQKHSFAIDKFGVFKPLESPTHYNPRIQNLEMPSPNGNSLRSIILKRKQELSSTYPRKNKSSKISFTRESKDTLYESNGFEGNPFDNGTPNDNDIAISNNGYLISVINSTIRAYDIEKDSIVLSKSLHQFSLGLAFNSKFDPKVIYDPLANRFILIYLNGYTFETSKIVVAFSTSDRPFDPWNIYLLPGNPINNSTWADYPVVGISSTDLYIGVNTFTNGSSNNSGFTESCLWQVDLNSGYGGNSSLITNYFSDILNGSDTLFNITPIAGGSNSYGPEMYLLSNKALNSSDNLFYILKVNNSAVSGSANISVKTVNSDIDYYLPPTGIQPNGHTLDLNDSRILGGFYENNEIQFVQSTLDIDNGNGAIFHGTIKEINSTSPIISSQILSDGFSDFGYPNIAYAGLNKNDHSSIINFNISSSNFNPGMGVVYFSTEGRYSPFKIIKQGDGHIDILTSNLERWGDYSGIQRKYDEPCTYWIGGSFGTNSNENGTWISKINTKDTCIIPVIIDSSKFVRNGLLYPNPSSDIVNINFNLASEKIIEIQLFDSKGSHIDKLYEDRAKQGENVFYFDVSSLNQGLYFVQFIAEGEILFQHKFVKN